MTKTADGSLKEDRVLWDDSYCIPELMVPWKRTGSCGMTYTVCIADLMVPWKRIGSCGMTAMADLRTARPSLLMFRSSA